MTATMTRHEQAEALRAEAARLVSEIHTEVAALRPLGTASELAMAVGARPRRGRAVSLPTGATVIFAKDRAPGPMDLARWNAAYRRSEQLRRDEVDLACWAPCPAGTTVGNRVFLAHGERLAEAGLLDDAELSFLAELRRFWDAVGDEDPNRVVGVVNDDGTVSRF